MKVKVVRKNDGHFKKENKKKIDQTTGLTSHFRSAGNDSKFPYITFDLREWNVGDINKHTYELTVDAWDRNETKRVIDAIDRLDRLFKQYKSNDSDIVLLIYHGSVKEFLDDEDKSIKRLERKYDVIAYEKGAKK